MVAAWYCTREDVKSALDAKETARNNVQVDRAIAASSRSIEDLMKRVFYPTNATITLDWPACAKRRERPEQDDGSRLIDLGRHELVSATTVTLDSTVLDAEDYTLEPINDGPPYTDLRFDASVVLSTFDRSAIEIAGVLGYRVVEEAIGSLAAGLASGAAATASVSWTTPRFGVGDVLRIDTERLIITNRTMVDSTQNLGAPGLTAQVNNVTVVVANGSGFAVDEVILIESERMLIVDVAGNNLTVKRAWDGSVLSAHAAGVDIYTLTGVELARGQLGTTDASHLTSATIYRLVFPDLIRQLCIAESIVAIQQENSGYARKIGSGDNQRPAGGVGLEDLRERAYLAHGRKVF